MNDRNSNKRQKVKNCWGKGGTMASEGTSVECKTFLNGNEGTNKERKDKTREKQSKERKKDYKHERKAKKCTPTQPKKGEKVSNEKKRNRNVHRTNRRLSRIAQPPYRLPHGTEPAMMLAQRRRPYYAGW
jgi:hypothetical protein